MKTARLTMFVLVSQAAFACSHAQPARPAAPPLAQARAPEARPPAPVEELPPATIPSRPEDAIYFSFDAALIRDDARPILQQIARELQLHPTARVRIEGNCDERGTTEYNLALGDQRARAAKQYLMRLGVPEKRIEVTSYGSERPRNAGHDEEAWAGNRRDDFLVR
jgi:peptidoglycan-associated lipoprotein